MSSFEGGPGQGGSGAGGAGQGGSGHGARKQKTVDPSVPRSGPWQDKPLTESQWPAEQKGRRNCLTGDCDRPGHICDATVDYTTDPKKG